MDCSSDLVKAVYNNVKSQSNTFVQALLPLYPKLDEARATLNFFQYALENLKISYQNAVSGLQTSYQRPESDYVGYLNNILSLFPEINYSLFNDSLGTTITIFPWKLEAFPVGRRPVMPNSPDNFTLNFVNLLQAAYDNFLPYAQQYQNIKAQFDKANSDLQNITRQINSVQTSISLWSKTIFGYSYPGSYDYVAPNPYLECIQDIPGVAVSITDTVKSMLAQPAPAPVVETAPTVTTPDIKISDVEVPEISIPPEIATLQTKVTEMTDTATTEQDSTPDAKLIQAAASPQLTADSHQLTAKTSPMVMIAAAVAGLYLMSQKK